MMRAMRSHHQGEASYASSAPPYIFLSHARGDDDAFIRTLRNDLIRLGFRVWLDEADMPGRGDPFPLELRRAIDRADRLLLVVTARVSRSEWCRAEWQYANVVGRPITLIVRGDGIGDAGQPIGAFDLIPVELKLLDLHAEDFRDQTCYREHLTRLEMQLREPTIRPGRLVNLPALPGHLLSRYAQVASLRRHLLSGLHRSVGITGVQGMGGLGKSVLAGLLARDPLVRRAFPDGVFWVTLGRAPALQERQLDLARALGYDGASFQSTEQGRRELDRLLSERAALLILDDIWTRDAFEALRVESSTCRTVLTTRDLGLVNSIGGLPFQLEFLSVEESMDLLVRAAHVSAQALPETAQHVARHCGNLPLALALCGGLVRSGVSWAGVLKRLEEAMFNHIRSRVPDMSSPQNQSIDAALRISVDALSAPDRERFFELTVLPADVESSAVAARTLWGYTAGLSEDATQDLIIGLRERSLLLPSDRNGIAFHDLLHAYASKEAGDPLRRHQTILAAYFTQSEAAGSRQWRNGPNDGYFLPEIVGNRLRN
jgi:hypothetical protein